MNGCAREEGRKEESSEECLKYVVPNFIPTCFFCDKSDNDENSVMLKIWG